MPKGQATVDFSEIFEYAKKKHGIEWNPCNDLFFGSVFEYGKASGFTLLELDSEYLPGYDYSKKDKELKEIIMLFKFDQSKCSDRYKDDYSYAAAAIIVNQFAIENKLPNEFLILS